MICEEYLVVKNMALILDKMDNLIFVIFLLLYHVDYQVVVCVVALLSLKKPYLG